MCRQYFYLFFKFNIVDILCEIEKNAKPYTVSIWRVTKLALAF